LPGSSRGPGKAEGDENDNSKSKEARPASVRSAREKDEKKGDHHMQYQPQLRPDQIEALYHLKVALRQPMTKLARAAVDCFLAEMKHKEEQALRAGTTLSDWLAYEKDMEEADAAAKQTAGLQDANALF
jgi:hypothetical protein